MKVGGVIRKYWRVLRGWFDDINPRGSFKGIYKGTFKGFFLRDL